VIRKTAQGFEVRIRCGQGKRERFYLQCRREPEAAAREVRMRAVADALVRAGHATQTPVTLRLLAAQTTEERFTRMEAKALEIAKEPPPVAPAPAALAHTWGQLGSLWLSGELHRLYPNKVNKLADSTLAAHRDRLTRLSRVIGDVTLTAFTEEDANRALRSLPAKQKWSTRKQYELLIFRVLRLAKSPCKLIKASPLEEGWVTKNAERPALSWLYPSEDARLMACIDVPFEFRIAYGFLAREGMRLGELLRLVWSDFDVRLGTVRLDVNKTKVPRVWRMDAGTVRALQHLWRLQGKPKTGPVFTAWQVPKDAAKIFRQHLQTAGVDRPELFEHSPVRCAIRVHDLRATFITVALSLGYAETTIMDRTGHKRSNQLQDYRRQARFAQELDLGPLLPLDVALGIEPEQGDYDGPGGPACGSASQPLKTTAGRGKGVVERMRVGHWVGHDHGGSMKNAGSERLEEPSLSNGNAQDGPKTRGKRTGRSGKKHQGPPSKGGLGQASEALRLLQAGDWAGLQALAASQLAEA
jgi:integrase